MTRIRSAAEPVPERMLGETLEEALRLMGRLVSWYHTHDSRRSQPGFPDYFIVAGRTPIAIELKREGGTLTDDQASWLLDLSRAGIVAVLAAGPDGVGEAVRLLERVRMAPTGWSGPGWPLMLPAGRCKVRGRAVATLAGIPVRSSIPDPTAR